MMWLSVGVAQALLIQVCFVRTGSPGDAGPCSPGGHSVIDDLRRSIDVRLHSSEQPICDLHLVPGWYRFNLNGSDAIIPTSCVDVNRCGTQSPIWLPIPEDGLPSRGQQKTVYACGSWQLPGQDFRCCMYRYKVLIRRCPDYFVYKLRSTWACDMAYCATVPTRVCVAGEKYYAEWNKCLEHTMHYWTYRIQWYVQDKAAVVLVQDSVQTTPNWAAIQVGRPVLPGQTVRCGVRGAVELEDLHGDFHGDQDLLQLSPPFYIGVTASTERLILKEDGTIHNITFTSRLCSHGDCNLSLRLSIVERDLSAASEAVLLSACEVRLNRVPGSVCDHGVCVYTVQVQAKPDVTFHPPREVTLSARLVSADNDLWGSVNISVLIRVEDLPSVDCFVVPGIHLISRGSIQKNLMFGGTYVMLKNDELFCESLSRLSPSVELVRAHSCSNRTHSDNITPEVQKTKVDIYQYGK
ncbi:hypothetical protein ScPMuIL_017184 [Solemya velum]